MEIESVRREGGKAICKINPDNKFGLRQYEVGEKYDFMKVRDASGEHFRIYPVSGSGNYETCKEEVFLRFFKPIERGMVMIKTKPEKVEPPMPKKFTSFQKHAISELHKARVQIDKAMRCVGGTLTETNQAIEKTVKVLGSLRKKIKKEIENEIDEKG